MSLRVALGVVVLAALAAGCFPDFLDAASEIPECACGEECWAGPPCGEEPDEPLSVVPDALSAEQEACIKGGGTWTLFNDSCKDACVIETVVIECTPMVSYGCDCGLYSCWAEERCNGPG